MRDRGPKTLAAVLSPAGKKVCHQADDEQDRGETNSRSKDCLAHPQRSHDWPNAGDQQLATMGLSTPQDVRARLLHRLVLSSVLREAFRSSLTSAP